MRFKRSQIRWAVVVALLLAGVAAAALAFAGERSEGRSRPSVGVRGERLVNAKGKPIRLLGVNRSSAEYECLEGEQVFEGPTDDAAIAAMKRWRINAVRLPLNESCWLGLDGVAPEVGGPAYREAVRDYVERLEAAGIYVILELQWAAPGDYLARGIIPMPDADHAPAFWRSVATEYRDDRRVLFDLYNEPHGIDWECWEWGCDVERRPYGSYRAVGMRRLVEVVRATGARQPLLLGGIDWSHDLSGWLEHLPPDPAHALVASLHTYDFAPCLEACREVVATIAARFPVVAGELGEGDCNHDYIDDFMAWADTYRVSYLGWAWNIGNGWTCEAGPALIDDYDGRPSPFGIGLRDHLRRLRGPAPG